MSESSGGGETGEERARRRRRVKVRTRVRVVTGSELRERRRRAWLEVRLVLFYAGLAVASAAAIWMGLKVMVKDPPLPKQTGPAGPPPRAAPIRA